MTSSAPSVSLRTDEKFSTLCFMLLSLMLALAVLLFNKPALPSAKNILIAFRYSSYAFYLMQLDVV